MISDLILERVVAIIVPRHIAAMQYLCCTAEIDGLGDAHNFAIWHRVHAKMEQVLI